MQVLSECFLEGQNNVGYNYEYSWTVNLFSFLVYEDFSNESQIEDFLDVIRNEVKEKLSMLRVKSVASIAAL